MMMLMFRLLMIVVRKRQWRWSCLGDFNETTKSSLLLLLLTLAQPCGTFLSLSDSLASPFVLSLPVLVAACLARPDSGLDASKPKVRPSRARRSKRQRPGLDREIDPSCLYLLMSPRGCRFGMSGSWNWLVWFVSCHSLLHLLDHESD